MSLCSLAPARSGGTQMLNLVWLLGSTVQEPSSSDGEVFLGIEPNI